MTPKNKALIVNILKLVLVALSGAGLHEQFDHYAAEPCVEASQLAPGEQK